MITSWKQLIIELDSLTKECGKDAWRTAQIVRELWRRKDFLGEACDNNPAELKSKLAEYSGRFALGLNEMIQMIEHFPQLKHWDGCRLDIIRDETCKLLTKETAKSVDGDTSRRRVTWAEYCELQEKYKKALKEIRRLKSELKKA